MADKLRLTREQLAKFCVNHEQIKQFESLFGRSDVTQDLELESVFAEASNALAAAHASADEIQRIKKTSQVMLWLSMW